MYQVPQAIPASFMGNHFTIRTDLASLTWLSGKKWKVKPVCCRHCHVVSDETTQCDSDIALVLGWLSKGTGRLDESPVIMGSAEIQSLVSLGDRLSADNVILIHHNEVAVSSSDM